MRRLLSHDAPGVESNVSGSNSGVNAANLLGSKDFGYSWRHLDQNYEIPGSTNTEAYAVEIAKDGAIYESGYGQDTSGIYLWYVKKFSHGSWELMELYSGETGLGAQPEDLYFGNEGNLFASGYELATPSSICWIVRELRWAN